MLTRRSALPLLLFLAAALVALAVFFQFGAPSIFAQSKNLPSAVLSLTLMHGDSQISIRWRAATSHLPLTGYDVHYTSSPSVADDAAASGGDPAAAWVDANHTGTGVTHVITGLTNGTTYRVRVRAVNSEGNGGWEFGTITPPLIPTIAFAEYSYVMEEANSATIAVTITPPLSSHSAVKITTISSSTAVAGEDYLFSLYGKERNLLPLPKGQAVVAFEIAGIPDLKDDGLESIVLNLQAVDNAPYNIADSDSHPVSIEITVLDDSTPSDTAITAVNMAASILQPIEGGEGVFGIGWDVRLHICLNAPVPEDGDNRSVLPRTAVSVVANGTTAQPADYVLPENRQGTGYIPPGRACITRKVRIVNDDYLDDGETVVLQATAGNPRLTPSTLTSNTVTITIRNDELDPEEEPPPNRAPMVSAALGDATIVNESGTRQVSLSGVFDDPDSDALSISAGSSDESVATVSLAADYSTLTVNAQGRGTATITVTARDGNGGTAEDTFTVTVKAAPVVASALADVTSLSMESEQFVLLSGAFSDADGDALTITAASSSESIATVSISADQSRLTVAGVAEGTATITVTAQDADGNRVRDAFEVAVTAPQQETPNSAPTVSAARSDATIVNQSGTKAVSLSGVFSDADNDQLTITAASSDETIATVSVATDYSTLTVNAQARGTAVITVTASDGNGGAVSDTFTVTVKASPVVASALADVTGLVEGATQDVSLSGVFSDGDGDALTISASSSDEGKATVAVASDQSKLTMAGVAEGTTTITVTARDADGNRVSDAFGVAVVKAEEPEQTPQEKYADLIVQMKEWRNDPEWVDHKEHTDRWDRALLAFGETVEDTSLTPMTAEEAQELADKGWQRWVEVAKALRDVESRQPEE